MPKGIFCLIFKKMRDNINEHESANWGCFGFDR